MSMSRYSCTCCIAVSVLLAALAVTASCATALPHEEGRLQDKRERPVPVKEGDDDAQLLEEATLLLGTPVVNKDEQQMKPSGGGADKSSSSSGGSSSKEREGGNNKEGDKQHPKNCLTKEACHKKKMICGKECTLSAHSKCAAKCSKSCVPTCS